MLFSLFYCKRYWIAYFVIQSRGIHSLSSISSVFASEILQESVKSTKFYHIVKFCFYPPDQSQGSESVRESFQTPFLTWKLPELQQLLNLFKRKELLSQGKFCFSHWASDPHLINECSVGFPNCNSRRLLFYHCLSCWS